MWCLVNDGWIRDRGKRCEVWVETVREQHPWAQAMCTSDRRNTQPVDRLRTFPLKQFVFLFVTSFAVSLVLVDSIRLAAA